MNHPRLALVILAALAATACSPGSGGREFMIQLAAFHDRPSADIAAHEARRRFPELEVVVEQAGELFRVALPGWFSAEEAQPPLSRAREL